MNQLNNMSQKMKKKSPKKYVVSDQMDEWPFCPYKCNDLTTEL
jgi:hypothetical protein